MRAASVGKMTEAEYLAFEEGQEGKHEFVNGDVVAMNGVTPDHDAVTINAVVALVNRLRGKPCRVRGDNLRVRLDETGLYAYPDLMVVCGPPQFAATRPETLLNPKVVVEVLSESTEDYDRGAKAAHYRHRASVEAILLIDSRRRLVELQTRNADGTWTLAEHTAGEVPLTCVGVSLPLDELYADVPAPAPPPG